MRWEGIRVLMEREGRERAEVPFRWTKPRRCWLSGSGNEVTVDSRRERARARDSRQELLGSSGLQLGPPGEQWSGGEGRQPGARARLCTRLQGPSKGSRKPCWRASRMANPKATAWRPERGGEGTSGGGARGYEPQVTRGPFSMNDGTATMC